MIDVTGTTQLLAVIGHPITHSLSPFIQNQFLQELNLPYVYMAFDVVPRTLKDFTHAARTLPIAGFNLTMPLKEQILPLLDHADDRTQVYGAVNTVVSHSGHLTGFNTDGDGFLFSLKRAGISCKGKKVLILGAGGAAKAIGIALALAGVSVVMATRHPETLQPILRDMRYCHWDARTREAQDCAILVNATPLGMKGTETDFEDFTFLDSLKPDAVVVDLIYSPRKTRLYLAAQERGFTVLNGLPLLLCQAALAFALFTGKQPSEEHMAKVERSLYVF